MTALDLSHFVRTREDAVDELVLAIEPIGAGCDLAAIEGAARSLPKVLSARLNLSTLRLTVRWPTGTLAPARLIEALQAIGCRAHPLAAAAEDDEARQAKWLLSCLAVAGFAAMNIMLLSVSVWAGNVTDITPETRDFFHWLSALIALPAAAYAGQPFFRSALAALRNRAMNMDVPISLGILLALGLSVVETTRHAEHAYFDSAVMLIFFLLCGRTLDLTMRRRTRAVAGNLAALKADLALRLDADGEAVAVPIAAVALGDRVLVRPGERCPVDGIVRSGTSEIDDSLVTGETALRPVAVGAEIHAGSLNHGGALTVTVTAAGDDTLLAEVERLLARAGEARSRYVLLADRAARLYAPVVHVAAALTAMGWLLAGASLHDALVTAIAVLIITCPCALALAVPAVQVVAAGALFRSGLLLVAGADAIERLSEIDTVVFDKTGTLTLPEAGIANATEIPEALLAVAGRLALSSHHPLAAPLARQASDRRPCEGAVELTGQGVEAVIDGVVARLGSPAFCGAEAEAQAAMAADPDASLVALAFGSARAVFRLRQMLRPDAAATIDALAARGLDVRILSGDRAAPVARVAGALRIGTWLAAQTPADKIAAIEALQAAGRRVLMVGDGVNDAPALAAAHAALSPAAAAGITQTSADALFLGERLRPVLEAVTVSATARRLMRQNLWLAVVYNAIAVPLAVAGHVTPLVAAAAMSGSSLLVTLNALRAGRRPGGGRNDEAFPGAATTTAGVPSS